MKHEIICGDALAEMAKLESGSFDAVICDPPYSTTQLAWDKPLDWAAIWPEIWRLCKSPTSPVVLFSAQPFTTDLICSQRPFFRYEIIWEKTTPTGFLDANRRPLRAHENILIFCRESFGDFYPQKTIGPPNHGSKTKIRVDTQIYGGTRERLANDESGLKFPKSVIRFGKSSCSETLHPTQKPLSLLENLVKTYSNEGDRILDFTCGSGTTIAAAARCKRFAVGIERDEGYAKIARERLEAATGKFTPRESHEYGGIFAETP